MGQSRQRSIDRPLIPLLRQPRQRPGVVCVAVGQKDSPQFLNLLCIQPGQVVLCASQQTAIHQKSSTILFHIKAVAAMFAAAPGNKKFHLNQKISFHFKNSNSIIARPSCDSHHSGVNPL